MDYGLLGGIAQGLSSGLDSYKQERDYQANKKRQDLAMALQQQQNQRAQESQELQERHVGLIRDASSGMLVETPEYQAEKKRENLYKQGELQAKGISIVKDPLTGEERTEQDPEFWKKQAANKKSERLPVELSTATELRKEFQSRPQVKQSAEIAYHFNNIKDSVKKGTAGSDMKMIYSLMKMYDPNSTVREGEYATAEQARGVPQLIIGLYNKAKDGQKLSEDQRKDFYNQASDVAKQSVSSVRGIEKEYGGLSKSYGVNPGLIYSPIKDVEEYQFPTSGAAAASTAQQQDPATAKWAAAHGVAYNVAEKIRADRMASQLEKGVGKK